MKYIECPKCKNKIIERYPLKCIYCGYDSTEDKPQEPMKLEALDPPKPPSRDSYLTVQILSILSATIGAIGYLVTFLLTRPTVVDYVLVETDTSNLLPIRWILLIMAGLAIATLTTQNRAYHDQLSHYHKEYRIINDINKKIAKGAKITDFDESEKALIIKDQENKVQNQLNQKTSKYTYNK